MNALETLEACRALWDRQNDQLSFEDSTPVSAPNSLRVGAENGTGVEHHPSAEPSAVALVAAARPHISPPGQGGASADGTTNQTASTRSTVRPSAGGGMEVTV